MQGKLEVVVEAVGHALLSSLSLSAEARLGTSDLIVCVAKATIVAKSTVCCESIAHDNLRCHSGIGNFGKGC